MGEARASLAARRIDGRRAGDAAARCGPAGRPRRRDPRRTRSRPATIVRGPWPVGIVGLVASRLVEDHGRPAVVGADLGRRHPGVVPERRPARSRRDPRGLRATCSSATAATPAPPASRSRPSAGPSSSRAVQTPRRAAAVPRRSAPAAGDRPRAAGARRRLRRSTATSPGSPRAEPATRSRSLRRPRPDRDARRAAGGGHTQLTLRRASSTCSTASPSAGRTSPRPCTRATASTSSRRLTSRTFGGFESLQLEIRDVATSGVSLRPRRSSASPRAQPRRRVRPTGRDGIALAGAPA